LSKKSDESESDARAYSCKLSSDKLKSASVSKKSGNVKPALCSKGDNDSNESVVAKQDYSDKVCVTRVYDESDNGTDKRPPNKSADRKSVSHRPSYDPKQKVKAGKLPQVSHRRHHRENGVRNGRYLCVSVIDSVQCELFHIAIWSLCRFVIITWVSVGFVEVIGCVGHF